MQLSLLLQQIIDNVHVFLLLGNLKGRQTVLVLNHEIRSSCYQLLNDGEMSEQGCGVEGSLTVLLKAKVEN